MDTYSKLVPAPGGVGGGESAYGRILDCLQSSIFP